MDHGVRGAAAVTIAPVTRTAALHRSCATGVRPDPLIQPCFGASSLGLLQSSAGEQPYDFEFTIENSSDDRQLIDEFLLSMRLDNEKGRPFSSPE